MATRRERRQWRGRFERYRALGIGVAVTIGVMAVVAIVSGSHGGDDPATAKSASATTSASVAPVTTKGKTAATAAPKTTAAPATVAPTTTQPDPGALPQTDVRPEPTSATLTAHAEQLWAAIVADDPAKAMPFFFPLGAYQQVKAISDPEHDWNRRLVAYFDEDIHTWHERLGANAARAQLVGISVPDSAQWIQPGAEFNKGSYWRVYGPTLRYQVDGREATFAISSMISWRGEWYVVHLASIR